ncbi:hypothetical protein HMPREF1612_02497 [Escherichia coli 908585]|nr:hypothetical protein HMPREF1612_02497 [Escherichia coli 908585]
MYYKSCFHDEHGRGLTLTPAMLVRTGQRGQEAAILSQVYLPSFLLFLFICY